MKQVRLNRIEIWIADHALPIFFAVGLAICAGAVAIFIVFLEQGETRHKVDVLRPEVTRVFRTANICSPTALGADQTSRDYCARKLAAGLRNCRHYERCRAAFLATLTYPPPAEPSSGPAGATEGGGAQNPSHAGQHPSPGPHPGGHGNGHHGGHESSPEAPQAPPAAESPGQGGGHPEGHEPPSAPPGNGQGGAQGGSSSGAGVEVCVELVPTCAGAEVGLGR